MFIIVDDVRKRYKEKKQVDDVMVQNKIYIEIYTRVYITFIMNKL